MELEALRSIYEGDESFRELSPVSFQYRVRHVLRESLNSLLEKTEAHWNLVLTFKFSGLSVLCLYFLKHLNETHQPRHLTILVNIWKLNSEMF